MPIARERLPDAASPQMAVLKKAAPRSTQGTMTIPEAMRLRAISGSGTSDLGQTFTHQRRSQIKVISDRSDPGQQDTICTALRPQIHPSATGKRTTHPILRLRLILGIHLNTSQLHAVITIAVTNLKQRC